MPKRKGGGIEGGPTGARPEFVFNSINDLQDTVKGPEIDRRLKSFTVGLTNDVEWAKEIVSRTYLKAIDAHRRGLFEEGTGLMSWLYRIAQNIWIDQLRAMKTREFMEAPLPQGEDMDQHDRGFMGVTQAEQHLSAESRQELELVREAIKTLSADEQELIALAEEGTSYAKMAEIQNVPIGTIMSRLGRARRRLRELTGRGKDDTDE